VNENTNAESQLRIASELADARLGVAEELGWSIAFLVATAAHLAWGSWLLTIGLAIAGYFLATYRYRRDSALAEDRYYRFAGLGKYLRQSKSDA
jgi:type II secretory pathway component PulF